MLYNGRIKQFLNSEVFFIYLKKIELIKLKKKFKNQI